MLVICWCHNCTKVSNDRLKSLQWRHNECQGVSNHQRLECLLNRLFRRRSKKTSRLHATGLCEGNPGESTGDQWSLSLSLSLLFLLLLLLLSLLLLSLLLSLLSSLSLLLSSLKLLLSSYLSLLFRNLFACVRVYGFLLGLEDEFHIGQIWKMAQDANTWFIFHWNIATYTASIHCKVNLGHIGSANGLLPHGIKPLPEPILTSH